MQQYVNQMIPPGLKAPQKVVNAEGDDAQGSEASMGTTVAERCTPEIVLEDV